MQKKVMVARFSTDGGKTNVGFMLIDEKFNISVLQRDAVCKLIMAKELENMEIANGEPTSTNGALKRYTCIDANTQRFIGNPRAVILSRIEDSDGNLKGYQIFGANNVVQKVSIEKAVQMAQNDMIVNGKLRNTSKGLIVSSISGEYPIWQIKDKIDEESREHLMNIVMFRSAIGRDGSTIKSVSVVVSYKNALEMRNDFAKLNESYTKLKDSLISNGYDSEDALNIRACGNSIACEIRFVDFQSIIRAKNVKVTSNFAGGDIVICCRDNNGNESAVKLGEKNEVIGKGTQETNDGVKKYAAIVTKENIGK